jgi:hypothetical protein
MSNAVEVYGAIQSADVTVGNTASKLPLWTQTITGGDLGSDKRIEALGQGKFSKTTSGVLRLRLEYGTTILATAVIHVAATQTDVGFLAEAVLSAKGAGAQVGTINVFVGTPTGDWGAQMLLIDDGAGLLDSNSTLDMKITAQFDNAAAGDTITMEHLVSTINGFTAEAEVPEQPVPNTAIFTMSKLNSLPIELLLELKFYAPLEHDLDFFGIGAATFTRASTSTAVWRDGVAHAVAINEPRFEYSGETPQGLAMSTSAPVETLTFPTANGLSDANTLIYVIDGVVKSTLDGDPNIFTAGGAYNGGDDKHLLHVFKFKRALTPVENATVKNIAIA